MDLIKNLVGEYTLLTLALVVLSTFLNRFVPPMKEQWRFLAVASVGMIIAYLMPPNDWEALLYGFIIAGLVVYKEILMDELRLVITAAKHVQEERANPRIKRSE